MTAYEEVRRNNMQDRSHLGRMGDRKMTANIPLKGLLLLCSLVGAGISLADEASAASVY